jgi:hypothetical protein
LDELELDYLLNRLSNSTDMEEFSMILHEAYYSYYDRQHASGGFEDMVEMLDPSRRNEEMVNALGEFMQGVRTRVYEVADQITSSDQLIA